MRKDGELGHKLGPRLVALVTKAVVAARTALAPHEARVQAAATQELIDRAGREVADLYRPVLQHALADERVPQVMRDHLAKVLSGKHQWQSIIGTAIGMSGAGSIVSQYISAALAAPLYDAISTTANLIPDVGTVAQLAARSLISYDTGQNETQRLGYHPQWYAAMVRASQQFPGSAELFDLVNRGGMPLQQAHDIMVQQGVPETVVQEWLHLRQQLLAPADAALAVLRGNMTHAEGVTVAKYSGVDAADFEILVGNTGEPLALEALLEAKRRGFIDQARLVRGILQSRTRNEWVDVATALEVSPMSTADAISAAVQGHMTLAEAKVKTYQNGLEPGDFQALYETAGEPLARGEMEQLYNRGIVTEAQVKQAIRESRVKNKYVDDAFALHTRLPEGRQIVSMITHGAVTKEQGAGLLAQLGYSRQVAGFLIAEGTNARLAAHHALTLAEIRELYAAAIITRAKAGELVAGLGYDAADAGMLLALWEQLAGAAITRQAVGVARSRYVAHVIDAQGAVSYLHTLGLPAAAIDRYVKTWTLERDATVRRLSEAQVVSAVKKSLITQGDGLARLRAMGYDAGDANVLLGMTPTGGPPGG